MQSLKKSVLFVLMAVLGTMLPVVSAKAQSEIRAVNVPFDFVAGTATLKAGSYRVEKQGPMFLSLTREDGQGSQFILAVPGGKFESRTGNPYLVFTRYRDEAFLKTVAISPDRSYDLLVTRKEKQHIKNLESGEEVALLTLPVR